MVSEPQRSAGARVRGLGTAKRGVETWRAERVTAIALVPLTLWLVASLVSIGGTERSVFTAWLGKPLSAFLMILLLVAAFRHAALGLQVVIEDYVHSALKIPLLLAAHLVCFAICAAGVLATLRIALGR